MKRGFSIVAVVAILAASLATAEAAGPLSLEASIPLGSRTHDLVIDGDLAYVVTDVGLTIVDISDPTDPFVRSAVSLGGRGYGITRQGALVFVANQTTGLKVINVANPDAPVVVATKSVPYAMDVAVKDDVAYVATLGGEMYLFRISSLPALPQIRMIGLLAWTNPGQDAAQLTKMNKYVASGNAKTTGVSITGNILLTVDWAYGRLFYYDVTDADSPIFAGTHYAPFMLRVESDPAGEVAYGFSAYSGTSGIYSVPISLLDPSISTRYTACPECGYFKSPPTDFGGLTLSSNSRYLVYLGGKQGVIQVVDVSNPANMTNAGSLPLTGHGMKLAESMGAQTRGDYIFAAAGSRGFLVYRYPGLSD